MILCARPHNRIKCNDKHKIVSISFNYHPPLKENSFSPLRGRGEFCYNAYALKWNVLRVVSGRVA